MTTVIVPTRRPPVGLPIEIAPPDPPGDALPSLLQALCSAAVGSLAGLVGGVLACAALVQLAACATPPPVGPAAPAVPTLADPHDEACDLRSRVCR